MENQNFDAFKPLNEEEEKKVVGGNAANTYTCRPIEQEIEAIEQQIEMFRKQHLPVPEGLGQELQTLERSYQKCMASSGQTS